jgi:hypothetical protein
VALYAIGVSQSKRIDFESRVAGRLIIGAVRSEAAFYSIADGVLTMHDEDGKPTGKTYRLGPADNERVIALRLTLERYRSEQATLTAPWTTRGMALPDD